MELLKFGKFLEEVEINLKELGKPIGDEKRGDVLIRKIKNKDELTTNNNKPIKVSKMKSNGDWVEPEVAIDNITTDDLYDPDKALTYFTKSKRYIPVFMDDDGDEFVLNQFKKTADFGSKGAGVNTKKFESLQCLFFGIKQAYPDDILSSLTIQRYYTEYLEIPERIVFLPEKIEVNQSLLNDFLEDKNWLKTFCKVPNRIWSDRYVDKNQLYSVYHAAYVGNDSPYVHIDRKYKQLAKNGGWSDINISKYCPADVYLTVKLKNDATIKQIDDCNTIEELTSTLNSLFDSKLLVPISLKKVEGKYKIITNSERDKNPPDFFIKSFHIGSDLKGIGSKISTTSLWKHRNNKDVDVKDRKINFDSSNTSNNVNVDGEVEGSASRHGKVSFNVIKRILDSKVQAGVKIQNLQTHSELRELTVEQLKSLVMKLVKTCQKLKKSIGGDLIQIDPIRGRNISNSENRLISRIQSLQIILAILQLHLISHKESNSAITKIMRYALSIETDKFRTPRYLRIM